MNDVLPFTRKVLDCWSSCVDRRDGHGDVVEMSSSGYTKVWLILVNTAAVTETNFLKISKLILKKSFSGVIDI